MLGGMKTVWPDGRGVYWITDVKATGVQLVGGMNQASIRLVINDSMAELPMWFSEK